VGVSLMIKLWKSKLVNQITNPAIFEEEYVWSN
jgi:hypothetical protein